jgi:hypothetical protein
VAILLLGQSTEQSKTVFSLHAVRDDVVYPPIVSTDVDGLICKI